MGRCRATGSRSRSSRTTTAGVGSTCARARARRRRSGSSPAQAQARGQKRRRRHSCVACSLNPRRRRRGYRTATRLRARPSSCERQPRRGVAGSLQVREPRRAGSARLETPGGGPRRHVSASLRSMDRSCIGTSGKRFKIRPGVVRVSPARAETDAQAAAGRAGAPRSGGRARPGASPRRRRRHPAHAAPTGMRADSDPPLASPSTTMPHGGRAPPRAPARTPPASPRGSASAASFAETNASYMPSPESGSTRPAASPTSRTRPRAARSHRARASAAGGRGRLERGGSTPCALRRAARGGRAAAALRSSSRRRRGSRGRPSGTPSRSRRARRRARPTAVALDTALAGASSQRTLPSSATPRTIPPPSPRAARRRRSRRRRRRDTQHARVDPPTRAVTPPSSELEPVDRDAVAEVRPGGRCLLGEVQVEPASLGHQDERLRARALEPFPR